MSRTLTGKEGARGFGPGKGATPEMIERLDTALTRYAHLIAPRFACRCVDLAGGGAAGGIKRGMRFAARSYGVHWRLSPMRFIWKRVLRMLI